MQRKAGLNSILDVVKWDLMKKMLHTAVASLPYRVAPFLLSDSVRTIDFNAALNEL